MTADWENISLLDLSDVFNMVDHSILLEYLKLWVGISGTVFNGFIQIII